MNAMYLYLALCLLMLWFCLFYTTYVKWHGPNVYCYDSAKARSLRTKWDRV